jgi:Cu(I)/Ag(I) efflux system membrane fusion protein
LYGQSEAQIRQLKNSKQTSPYITYSSPADGTVSELFVAEGQYVAEGSSILSLEGYYNIWVEADLYPAEANLVKKGTLVNVTVTGFENEPAKMQIDFIAPALQSGNQLLTIRGSILNPRNQFKAGMQAMVEVPITQNSGAITLPVEAVIREEQGAHVWIQTARGEYKPQMVQTGSENFDRVEINSGLNAGDVVVVSGAYLLYSEFKLKKGKDPMAGHNH